MSKKSKKILAYLMFVAALCGTPAVSEARGGSGGQVETEKASASQRGGNLSQSFISYLIKNYGFETAKWMLLGGGGFGAAKFSKAGDFNTWASYLLNLKSADLKKAENLMNQFEQEKAKFESEKKLFEQSRVEALKYNDKLVNDNNVLGIKNLALAKQVGEGAKTIEELTKFNKNLNDELSNLRVYNDQLLNLNNEDNKKIDALLSEFLTLKMSGELNIFRDGSWKQESYNGNYINKVVVEPYSGKEGVKVVIMKYDHNGNALDQQPEWLTLPADGIIDAIKSRVGDDLINISLKDIGLGYRGITRLARYSYTVDNDIVAAYFPVKSFQVIDNVENNENNENADENANENNDINGENNENNEGNGN